MTFMNGQDHKPHRQGGLKLSLNSLHPELFFPLCCTGSIGESCSPLAYVCHGTFVPLFFMRILSYSELKKKITHLYSLHCSLGFIPIAIVTGAAMKKNSNVSKELSALLLETQ